MGAVFVGDDTWNGRKTWRNVNLSKARFCVDDRVSSIDDRRIVSNNDTKWVIHADGNDLSSVLLDTYSDRRET